MLESLYSQMFVSKALLHSSNILNRLFMWRDLHIQVFFTTVKKNVCIGFDKRPRKNRCKFCFTNELYRGIEIIDVINVLMNDLVFCIVYIFKFEFVLQLPF